MSQGHEPVSEPPVTYWSSPVSEPLTLDVMLDAAAAICGECSPELRDRYRAAAVEARADGYLRTLDQIRKL